MKTFRIALENVRFFARHGIFDFEKKDGNNFIVNLFVDFTPHYEVSEWNDGIGDTISYVVLYDIVKKEMEITRDLLETVALNIVENIVREFDYIDAAECRITKMNPPIPDFNGAATVTYKYIRDNV